MGNADPDLEPDDGGRLETPRLERLQKILSAHGVISRRGAEQMIKDRRVSVNGVTAELGQRALAGRDMIEVDGAPLEPRREKIYIMLNKPRGYITTANDERGRKTVMELVADAGAKVYPVGRLDMDSEGLLLLTNDGDFAETVAHPSHNKLKTYEVYVRGKVKEAADLLRSPMMIGSHTVRADSVDIVKGSVSSALLRITIHEGRNRQIRKMCANCRLEVESLRRVAVGSLELGPLDPGKWRHLTNTEVRLLLTR